MQVNAAPGSNYHIITYGCQMNVRDSETMAGLVEAMGYQEVDNLDEADLVIFNTCSVRHSAENKVYGKLGEVNAIKKKHPSMLIAFGGCMAQLPEVKQRLYKIGVDIIFGTHNIHELPAMIDQARDGKKRVEQIWTNAGEVIDPLPALRRPGLSAFVNVMYGCNNFCSYCIVPYTRGRERSRTPDNIQQELEELAMLGYREVTLLGQNVNSYGKGLDEKVDFADILVMASKIDGLERIRFTTSHPKDMSDKLIDTIASHDKLCEHIHVPLQAGSNKILQRMNRGYNREHYLELAQKMRERIPGVAITSDLIVGFPGETDEDFENTLDMVRKVRFDAAFTFLYSIRTGTKAATFEDQVPLEVKKSRLLELNRVQYGIALELNKKLEGTCQELMVEGPSKTNPEKLSGRTRTNRIVIFSGQNNLIGSLINVKITKGKTFSLFGDVQQNDK